jgi:hypothetical protein
MSVDPKNATVKALNLDPVTVKIEDVFDSTEVKEFTKKDGTKGEIKLPYRIRIIAKKEGVVSEEDTQSAVNTNDWSKKFYTKDGYVNYTRNQTLLAVIEILRKMEHKVAVELDEKGEFNINDLKNVKFEAILHTGDAGNWINWVLTFKHHGIPVPQSDTKPEAKEEETEVDEDSLPF